MSPQIQKIIIKHTSTEFQAKQFLFISKHQTTWIVQLTLEIWCNKEYDKNVHIHHKTFINNFLIIHNKMLTSSQFLTSGSKIKKKSSLIPSTHQSLKANISKDFLISQESTRQLLIKDSEEYFTAMYEAHQLGSFGLKLLYFYPSRS